MNIRLRATASHLAFSALLAIVSAILVFRYWYPNQYREVAGGLELFLILISVDIALGPLLTFVIANPAKARRILKIEISVICALQISALIYGMHSVYIARPVVTVFEVDRFRVLTPNEIDTSEFREPSVSYKSLSITGPELLGTRRPQSGAESTDALFKAVEGFDIGQRPRFWQPYQKSSGDALAKSRSVQILLDRYPAEAKKLAAKMRYLNINPEKSRFLPVNARGDWVAVLDEVGQFEGFLPVDGFFK